eukprot:2162335-Pyramimonas_sp.AAC.1
MMRPSLSVGGSGRQGAARGHLARIWPFSPWGAGGQTKPNFHFERTHDKGIFRKVGVEAADQVLRKGFSFRCRTGHQRSAPHGKP